MSDMQKLQVGDTITTAEELDALPLRTVVRTSGDEFGSRVFQRCPGGWSTFGTGLVWSTAELWGPTDEQDESFAVTILYLPGHPPRPEGVVAAQALREWADAWDATLFIDGVLGPDETSLESTHARRRADRIEGGAV